MKPLLSVVVPVYNAAKFLPHCLDSLCGQTYRNLEIVCVNDGSTDASLEVLKEYASRDTRIKVIHQENAGVSAARNRGLDAAPGELVAFVDADDWLEREAYEKVVERFSEGVDLVAIGGQLDGETEDAEEIETYFNRLPHGRHTVSPAKCADWNISLPTKVFRREILVKYDVRFPVGVSYGEDSAFVCCVLPKVREIYNVGNRYYHYVQHGGSAMHDSQRMIRLANDLLSAWTHVVDFYSKQGVLDEFWPVMDRLFSCVCGFLDEGIKSSGLRDVIWQIACKCGLPQRSHDPQMHRMKMYYMPAWKRLFHWYRDDCECFGICGMSLYSVTYKREERFYRVMGRLAYKKTVNIYE